MVYPLRRLWLFGKKSFDNVGDLFWLLNVQAVPGLVEYLEAGIGEPISISFAVSQWNQTIVTSPQNKYRTVAAIEPACEFGILKIGWPESNAGRKPAHLETQQFDLDFIAAFRIELVRECGFGICE